MDTLPRLPRVEAFQELLDCARPRFRPGVAVASQDQPLDATIFRQLSPTSFLVEVPLPGSSAEPVVAYLKDNWSLGSPAKGKLIRV